MRYSCALSLNDIIAEMTKDNRTFVRSAASVNLGPEPPFTALQKPPFVERSAHDLVSACIDQSKRRKVMTPETLVIFAIAIAIVGYIAWRVWR